MTSINMSNDDILRRAFAARDENAVPRRDCPDPAVLFDATTGAATSAQLAEILEHSVGCGSCAESWRLAVALDREMGSSAKAAWTRPTMVGLIGLAAAAAIVIAVAIPVLMERSSRSESIVWRSEERLTIASYVNEDQQIPREGLVLRWSEPAPGARYAIVAANEKLEPLISRDGLPRPEFPVPAETLASQPAGGKVYWHVTATLPDGRKVTSPTFIATLQ